MAEVTYSANYTETIAPFAYQSKSIPFSDWAALITLCLAPLIAHVVSGVSDTVYLSQKRPAWHERVCQYNPTTILWRYFAISDRRFRARAWSPADLAASSANFWTSRGWDGSEEMVGRSRAYCTKLPDSSRATLLSGSSIKTLIITLQGAQALYTLVEGLKNGIYGSTVAIDSIFFPLAVFGLVRLSAALWLTDDYHYAEAEDLKIATTSNLEASTSTSKLTPYAEAQTMSSMGLLEIADTPSRDYFRPTNSWRGVLTRVFFLLPIMGLWIICCLYVLPWRNRTFSTITTLISALFYLFFLSASIVIYSLYFLRGRSATTIIPCINSLWYKVYTFVLFVFIVIVLVVAAIETRKTSCGKYTTWPPSLNDLAICGDEWIPVIANSAELPFGIATYNTTNASNGTLIGNEFRVAEFNGWCQTTGLWGATQIVAPVNSSTGST